MTTPPTDSTRAGTAAILRAAADLIESREDIAVPSANISFYVRGDDVPATMAAIAAALPCQWRAEISRGTSYESLVLRSGQVAVLHGAYVSISGPAADACTPAGSKTVTVWEPAGALAGLVGPDVLGEAD
jgi:hypothetical protein